MKKFLACALVLLLPLTACTAAPAASEPSASPGKPEPASADSEMLSAADSAAEMLRRPDPVKHTPDEPAACVDYIYDVEVPEQAAYYHDYVFSAEVVAVGEVFDPYWEPEYLENYDPLPFYDPCYTQYRLRVTECIKGGLRPGDIITARRQGYYDETYQAYLASTDGVMPEVGAEYLCLASRNETTGRYDLSTPYTMIPMEAETREDILAQYTEACRNAVRVPSIMSTDEDYDYVTLYADILQELLAPVIDRQPYDSTFLMPYLDLRNAPGGLSQEALSAIGKTFAIAHGFSMEFRSYETVVSQGYFDEEGDRDFGVILSIAAAEPPTESGDPWTEYFTVRLWTAAGETRYENCYVTWMPAGPYDSSLLEYQIGPERHTD